MWRKLGWEMNECLLVSYISLALHNTVFADMARFLPGGTCWAQGWAEDFACLFVFLQKAGFSLRVYRKCSYIKVFLFQWKYLLGENVSHLYFQFLKRDKKGAWPPVGSPKRGQHHICKTTLRKFGNRHRAIRSTRKALSNAPVTELSIVIAYVNADGGILLIQQCVILWPDPPLRFLGHPTACKRSYQTLFIVHRGVEMKTAIHLLFFTATLQHRYAIHLAHFHANDMWCQHFQNQGYNLRCC